MFSVPLCLNDHCFYQLYLSHKSQFGVVVKAASGRLCDQVLPLGTKPGE